MLDVIVVGSFSLDMNVTPDRSIHKVGGAVTYSGLTYARLGLCTGVVFNLAERDRAALDLFARAGVTAVVGDTTETTRFVNDMRGDTRLQQVPTLASPVLAKDIRRALRSGATHLHLGPLHWHDIDPDFILESGASPLTVSTDVQGLVRRPDGAKLVREVSPLLEHVLRSATFVKASMREMELILSHLGLLASEMLQKFDLQEILVTESEAGGVIVDAAGDETRYGAEVVQGRVCDPAGAGDPTGAGDVFFAAYLTARLHREQSIADASQYAAHVAARHVQGEFLTEDLLSLDRYLTAE